MSMREKTQADFDLERLFELMDEALTSKDERVQNALRGLLTIIELTRTQDDGKNIIETSHGPLRQMQQDLNNLRSRIANVENQLRQQPYNIPTPYPAPMPTSPMSPYVNPAHPSAPGTWWGPDPNAPYTTGTSTKYGVGLQPKLKELK